MANFQLSDRQESRQDDLPDGDFFCAGQDGRFPVLTPSLFSCVPNSAFRQDGLISRPDASNACSIFSHFGRVFKGILGFSPHFLYIYQQWTTLTPFYQILELLNIHGSSPLLSFISP